jgi:hypothetical protein
MITTYDIRMAYRLILGREPENDEIVKEILQRAYSLAELRREFLTSREFRTTTTFPDMAKPLDWAPLRVSPDVASY